MRNRRKLRVNLSPPTKFWVKTESMDASYVIPKFSVSNLNLPVRIKFDDGTQLITSEPIVDLSVKTGVKTIEYLEKMYSDGLNGIIFPVNNAFMVPSTLQYYFGDMSSFTVQKFMGKQKILNLNYKIVDLDSFQNRTRFFFYDLHLDEFKVEPGQTFNKLQIVRNKKPMNLVINEDRIKDLSLTYSGFNITYNTNMNALEYLQVYYGARANLDMSRMPNIRKLQLYTRNLTVSNADNKLDLSIQSQLDTLIMQNTAQTDVLFYPKIYTSIYIHSNSSFINIDKVIPESPTITVVTTSYKSITLTNPATTKSLNVQGVSAGSYGNPKSGTDILNLQDAVNLEKLNLIDNPQAITTYSDFSTMPNLTKLQLGGNNDGVTAIVPPSLTYFKIKENTGCKNLTVDLTNNLLLEELYILYANYSTGERVTFPPTLNSCKDLTILYGNWSEVTVKGLIDKLITNPITNGKFAVQLNNLTAYNNTAYSSLPIDVKNLVDSCRQLKQKGWTVNSNTSLVIKNNI